MRTSLRAVNAGFSTIHVPEQESTPTPATQLTPVQQMQQLHDAGVSPEQIAATMGLPKDVVSGVLATTAELDPADDTAFPGGLSIFV